MPKVPFLGEEFELAEKIGMMPVLRFAKLAKNGLDSEELEGLVAIYDLLEQCFAPQEWQRFQDHAVKVRADGEQLMEVAAKAMGEVSNRPTEQPSDSSAGLPITSPSSTGDSFSRVKERFERQGRPDLALLVMQAQVG